jgi:RND family efflux transporter MFP subunit
MSVVKLGVFIIVTALVAIGAYFGAQIFLLSDDTDEDTRRPVAVKRGTLLDDVAASGSVSFPELESLRFEISGIVGDLPVEEGDTVVAGQTLVGLDAVTVSALESEVASAEVALQDAGEDLAEILNGATTLDRAIAESNLADARVASMNAAKSLAEFTSASGSDSPATVAAKAELDDANEALADALKNAEDDAESQADAVADALKNAEDGAESQADAVADALKNAEDDAKSQADAVADALKNAEDDAKSQADAVADAMSVAEDVAKIQTELVSDALEVFDDAVTAHSEQITGWFGAVVTEEDQSLSPIALAEKWGASVDDIFDAAASQLKSPTDDPTTPWSESLAWVWTHLTPYPILTNCDESASDLAFRCPSAEIKDSWDLSVEAEESLAEVVEDTAEATLDQQNLISAAQDDEITAAKDHQVLISAAQDDEITAAKDHQVLISAAQDDEITAAKDHQVLISAAQDDIAAAVEDIVETVNDIDINALAATLRKWLEMEKDSEATLAEIDDIHLLQINLATAAVNGASAQLDQANDELTGAVLVAPFDGVVTSISVSPGDPVNRNTATIDVLDPSVVTVEGSIDEIDVLSLKLGDDVSVILDALPDQVLEGVIDEIGDGVNQQGVIEFPLIITLTPPEGVELIEGLSATATIVLNRIDNALLIPLQAVGGGFDQPTVDVVSGEGFVTTNVSLGASDDFWVVVELGLSEGQEVLMTVADEQVDPFQQFFGRGGGGAIRIPAGGGGFTGPAGGGRGGQGGGGGQ